MKPSAELINTECPRTVTYYKAKFQLSSQGYEYIPKHHGLLLPAALSNHCLKFSSIDHRRMNYEGVWRSWRLRLVRGSLQKNAPAQRHLQVGRE